MNSNTIYKNNKKKQFDIMNDYNTRQFTVQMYIKNTPQP